MTALDQMLLAFRVEDRRYAFHLAAVLRVLPMVHVEPLPGAPGVVDGIVDVGGRIVPVVNLRRRVGLPERESRLGDVLILAQTRELTVAVPADGVAGVVEMAAIDAMPDGDFVLGADYVSGVVQFDDGLTLIHDLDLFLSLHERQALIEVLDDATVRQ